MAASGIEIPILISGANDAITLLNRLSDGLINAATRFAALADEQARLDTASRDLGLNFDAAAASAGRFVDETEAMGVANRFAAADIRLTQQQLNDVMRVAGASADMLGTDTAGAVDTLREALIRGREGGLERFGQGLAALSGESHTVEERFAALHARAGEMAQATDTATDRLNRFKDSLEDSARTFASAFVNELARLVTVGEGIQSANDNAEEFQRTIAAVGATAASVATRVVLGVGIIGGAIGTVVGGLTGMVQLAAAATHGLAAFNAERDRLQREGLAAQSVGMVQDAINRLEAIEAESEQRTTAAVETIQRARAAAPTRPPPPRPTRGGSVRAAVAPSDMTFTAEQVAADEQAARISALEDLAGLAHDRSEERRRQEIDGLIEEEAVRQQVAADARGIAAMEDANLRQRLAAHQTFTGRMAEMYGTQMDGIGALANFTKGAFQAMGTAVGDHVTAMVTGRESVGTALQGMASDMLLAIGKQAMVKGAFELAEGFGALAGVATAPLAPGHFAASAAYFAVGALASAAGAAIAPAATTAAPSAAAAPGAGRAGDVTPGGAGGMGGGSSAGPIVNNYYAPIVGGRQSTDAETGVRIDRYNDAARARLRRAA
jgi:hypothetical protein